MNRLTLKRVNGIKHGYWSVANKEMLVQALAAYENTGLTPKEIMSARTLVGCWIPVNEKLPANEDKVLICTITKTGNKNILVGYYSPDLRRWVCGMNSNVIAWQPLPEPYTEISTND